jgi:uncharacterized protein (TIGR02266 family)
VVRLALPLADKADWVKVFDPRGGGLFVPTPNPPEVGVEVRVDLTIAAGGPRVILKGMVAWRRTETDARNAAGCSVSLAIEEREKVNFLNGFVRGGLINRRERRRLPLRLPVVYATSEGTRDTFSRDINEEGIFILSDAPLAEESSISVPVKLPGREQPLALRGVVSHTVILEDEDVPGMGVRFVSAESELGELTRLIDDLEAHFLDGSLPEDVIS